MADGKYEDNSRDADELSYVTLLPMQQFQVLVHGDTHALHRRRREIPIHHKDNNDPGRPTPSSSTRPGSTGYLSGEMDGVLFIGIRTSGSCLASCFFLPNLL